ncbi:MAG: hypothetical protein H7Z13_17625 [Ferruginibacter sp.]|nr:hypothetical protein [Ferruginibacter sp.]
MQKNLVLICWLIQPVFSHAQSMAKLVAQPAANCNQVYYLKNDNASFGIDLLGGAFTDFKLTDSKINPFTWAVNQEEMPENNRQGAAFKGHFLCLGRWGAPTDGEIKAGVPHNGQSGNNCWQLDKQMNQQQLVMRSNAPLDGISVQRTVVVDKQSPVVKVTERVQATTTIARLFNMVQHATIGPPFLDTATIIDCNAGKGFLQSLSYPDPYRYEFRWPNALADSAGSSFNLRSSATPFSYVSTHIFNDSIGWITATNATEKLMLGYIWKTSEYPWVNVWQQWRDDRLWAKGLEFGTTGIGKSYRELLAVDTRFHGTASYQMLDAGETFEKSFCCFLLSIPTGFKGVKSVKIFNGNIVVAETGTDNNIMIPTTLTL